MTVTTDIVAKLWILCRRLQNDGMHRIRLFRRATSATGLGKPLDNV